MAGKRKELLNRYKVWDDEKVVEVNSDDGSQHRHYLNSA